MGSGVAGLQAVQYNRVPTDPCVYLWTLCPKPLHSPTACSPSTAPLLIAPSLPYSLQPPQLLPTGGHPHGAVPAPILALCTSVVHARKRIPMASLGHPGGTMGHQ